VPTVPLNLCSAVSLALLRKRRNEMEIPRRLSLPLAKLI
jgi:hypothetical protein